MPTQLQPPPQDLHHEAHNKHANALHRDALMQALGSILAPKRPTITGRSSSASTVDSSRSSSGTASPAHGHPAFLHLNPHAGPHAQMHSPAPPPPPPHSTPVPNPHQHPHPPSPLSESMSFPEGDTADAAEDAHASAAEAPTPIAPAPRAKIIDSLKNKNGAWDALIHGSFS
ncbi:hypothetical protein MVEN_01666400 [Mycena venus]|uniref:Uncharacterized protein n=1 Tax=Mycena venus TaxID=2733690 RepID=A0A8H6XRA4_9AGAR|nr:hypothetical protein MVEN_01666400 [Mycena venus]